MFFSEVFLNTEFINLFICFKITNAVGVYKIASCNNLLLITKTPPQLLVLRSRDFGRCVRGVQDV